jgi:hypothetical protein
MSRKRTNCSVIDAKQWDIYIEIAQNREEMQVAREQMDQVQARVND